MCRVDGRKSCHNPLSYPYPADRSTSQVSVARMVRDHCGCPGTPGLGSRGVVNTEMAVLWYRCVLRLPYLTSPSRFQSRQPEKKKNDQSTGPLEQGRPPLKLDGPRAWRFFSTRPTRLNARQLHHQSTPYQKGCSESPLLGKSNTPSEIPPLSPIRRLGPVDTPKWTLAAASLTVYQHFASHGVDKDAGARVRG